MKITPRGGIIAGLGGGSGKSIVSVGITAACRNRGHAVVPFKKGPDYIDSGWLQLAAGNPCYNLDPFLMAPDDLLGSFYRHAQGGEIILVEGNRGLYDGVNAEGGFSTAELSLALTLPVFLVVDCTKTTRTVAAMVLGCCQLDQRVDIRGVILNRIGTSRHEAIVRQAVEQYTPVRVLGAVPRLAGDVFPQRHLGVTPFQEHEQAADVPSLLAAMAENYLDLDAVIAAMTPLSGNGIQEQPAASGAAIDLLPRVRIGLLQDAAFQFYYPENIEALVENGAEIVPVNAMEDKKLPKIDALYIGGGFPETGAGRLAANRSFRESVKDAAERDLPIYAECGGLIYLGESIVHQGKEYPLCGVFPVKFGMARKPQAHGYTVLEVVADNPFYPEGLEIKGHEFRYSRVESWIRGSENLAFFMKRGVGFKDGMDGLVYRNTLALYTHIHAVSTPEWAIGLVRKALEHKGSRGNR